MDADLRDLLSAWLGNEDPGEERRQELLERLRHDADFRAAFVAEINMLGMLKAAQAPEPRWLRLADELGWSRQEEAPVAALENRIMQQVRAESGRRGRVWLGLALAASVAIAFFGVLNLVRVPDRPVDPTNGVPAVARTVPAAIELASVIGIEGVEWTDEVGDRVVRAGAVTAGRLRFLRGALQLQFASGVVLTMEGPADIEILSGDRVFCHQGKLRVRVPTGAEGFAVVAPGYEVVDLGTEFALNQEPGKRGEVMVLEGQAAVSVLDDQGRTRRSALLEGPRAVAVDAQTARISPAAIEPNQFAATLELPPPGFSLSPAYPRQVMDSKPWAYWRFENQVDDTVPNELPGHPGLRLLGGVSLEDTAKANRCLRFLHDMPEQAAVMDGTWTPPRAEGYAIEIWIQAESQGQSALVSLIADEREERPERHLMLMELTARGQQSPHDRCAFRFLDRWPPSAMGGMNLFSRRQYLSQRWHHLVAQKSGDTLELYIDGVLVGTTTYGEFGPELLPGTLACQLLLGRLKQRPPNLLPVETRYFVGRMDELALYDRALTADEIRQHFECRAQAE